MHGHRPLECKCHENVNNTLEDNSTWTRTKSKPGKIRERTPKSRLIPGFQQACQSQDIHESEDLLESIICEFKLLPLLQPMGIRIESMIITMRRDLEFKTRWWIRTLAERMESLLIRP